MALAASRSSVVGARASARASFKPVISRRSVVVRAEAASAVNDETFQSVVLESKTPVLVDFWAPWCGPCRMIAPIVDELAGQYSGKLKCVKVNTDESPNVATKYNIRSIPTIMIFKAGKQQDTIIGAVPKATIEQTIEKYL